MDLILSYQLPNHAWENFIQHSFDYVICKAVYLLPMNNRYIKKIDMESETKQIFLALPLHKATITIMFSTKHIFRSSINLHI